MTIGYIRLGTDRQIAGNQRFDILKFVDEKKWTIEGWAEKSVGGTSYAMTIGFH